MNVKEIITTPVGRTILIITLLILFAPMAGAINQWTLFTKDKGVVDNERIDRVVYCGADLSACTASTIDADALWAAADLDSTGTALASAKFMKIEKSGTTGCVLETSGTLASNPAAGITPGGEVISMTTLGVISGCTWEPVSSLFNRGATKVIVTTLLAVAGLGLPIGGLVSLGQFGSSFIQQAGGGGMAIIMSGVLMLVGLLLLAILGSSIIPFAGTAVDALDADRYVMYGGNLGGIAPILGDFWGVALVGGVVAVGWQVISFYRNAGNGAGGGVFSSSDSGRM